MPVIAFASPKGGAGKTTSSLILATSLVAHTQNPNFRVVIIDGDNNHPHIDWANANADTLNRPRNLEIMAAPSEAMIMDEIKAAKARANFVLVDLEGAATALLTYAITLADFVVVPLQGSKLDGTQARKIVKLMENLRGDAWQADSSRRALHTYESCNQARESQTRHRRGAAQRHRPFRCSSA